MDQIDVESIYKGGIPIVCNFSGGRTSATLTILIESMRKAGIITAPVEYLFIDTGAEHPKTYDFIRRVVEYAGIELTCLRAVIDPTPGVGSRPVEVGIDGIGYDLSVWRAMLAKHSTPFIPSGGFCTARMKSEPVKYYLDKKYGKGGFIQLLGMRADEPKRLVRVAKTARFYMADAFPDIEKIDVLKFWREMPFDLEIDEWLGNCVFCVKKRPNKIALAAMDAPDLADDFWALLNEPTVKVAPNRPDPCLMYRDWSTLKSIRESFSSVPRGEIIARLKMVRLEDDADQCSESCEAMVE